MPNFTDYALYELVEYYKGRMTAEWDHTSLLCALIANCHSAKKKFKPKQFNPFMRTPKPELDGEQAKEWLRKQLGR